MVTPRTKPSQRVDGLDADGIGIGGLSDAESATPPPRFRIFLSRRLQARAKAPLGRRSEKRLRRERRKKDIVIRATLPHGVIEHLIWAMAPRIP